MAIRHQGLQRILYHLFLESGRHNITALADVLGYDVDHTYRLVNKNQYMPADVMNKVIAFVEKTSPDDADTICAFLLRDTGRVAVPVHPQTDVVPTLEQSVLNLCVETERVTQQLTTKMVDAPFLPGQAAQISGTLKTARGEINKVLAQVILTSERGYKLLHVVAKKKGGGTS